MGLFDFFGKESRIKENKSRERSCDMFSEFQTTNEVDNKKGPVSVFNPSSYSDVETIINCLKSNKTAIVHLTNLKPDTAIRILDMLSGAIYALGGGVYEMEKNIFMFSPCGVEIF